MSRDCVKRIVEQTEGLFSKDDANKLLKDVDRLAKKRVQQGVDKDDAIREILDDRALNAQENYIKQKQNILKNVAIKQGSIDRINNFITEGLSIKEAFQAELVGINKNVTGGRISIDATQQTLTAQLSGKLLNTLEKQDLLGVFNSKKLTNEIASELWDLSAGNKGKVSGSKEAFQIAKAIHEVQETIRVRLNRAGADIGEVDGFIMNQTHDPYRMAKQKKEAWVEFIRPLVDTAKSFDATENLDDALEGAYEALITGIRLDDPTQAKDTKLFQFTGPSNLAKRLSGKRVIHFKDAESFLKYNEKFGYNDLNEGVVSGIQYGAKNIALMERLGTNPRAMVESVLNKVKKDNRGKIATEGQKFDRAINTWLEEVIGISDFTGSPKWAQIGSNIRAWQAITKLGGATLSAISDTGFKALEYQYQGKNFLTSYAQPFIDLAQGFKSKKERVEFASLIGAGAEGFIGDVGARFSSSDSPSGTMSKIQRGFFKLNGLTWWTETHKLAMGKIMAHDLALKKNKTWNELDVDTKRNFNQYNITEVDWNNMRSKTRKMDDGREYLFPEDTGNEKLGVYYQDRVNFGVITGGARERAIATQGLARGTPAGEAIRYMMQFKQFPITAVTKLWGRALYSKGKADVPALIQLALVSGGFGYLALSAKDLVSGKKPRDPLAKETIFAAMTQGGGYGILGDFMFADANSYGGGPIATLAGPTAGTAEDFVKILSKASRGEDFQTQLVRSVRQNIPLQNLFYIKPAVDYLMMYQVQENLSKGYLRRMEKRMKKDYNQEFWLRPSDVAS